MVTEMSEVYCDWAAQLSTFFLLRDRNTDEQ
jgi:hypothetical protein